MHKYYTAIVKGKKTKSAFLLLSFFFHIFSAFCQVTIGNGTSSGRSPFNYYYGYTRTASIYTAAEMNTTAAGGTITTISWYSNVNSTFTGPAIIYLKQVDTVTIVASDTWANTIAGATQVYASTPFGWVQGWNTLDITDYAVAAGQNLAILVECNYGGSGTSVYNLFRYTTTPTFSNAYWQANNTPPTGLPIAANTGAIITARPNVILAGLTPPPCPAPPSVAVGSISTSSASVSFSSAGNSFIAEYGPVGFTPGTGAAAGTNGTIVTGSSSPIILTGLAPSTDYTVYVRQNCTASGNGYSNNPFPVSFTTDDACIIPIGLTNTSVSSNSATIGFTASGNSFIVEYGLNGFVPGTGSTAGTGGAIVTGSSSPITITGLSAATAYAVYVRQNCTASGNGYSRNSSKDSLTTPSVAPPPNDGATGALTITVGAGCSGATYSNAGATKLSTEPGAACSGTQTTGKNVWFKFIAPASGFIKASTDVAGNTLIDTKMALYSVGNAANYSTFQIIGCDDDNGVTVNAASALYATGLTPGQYYYLVVDDYNGTATGNFCLRVDEANTTMIADTGLCEQGQLVPEFRADYKGWASLTNNSGQLIANIRSTANLTNVVNYFPYITIRTGAVRQVATGEYYLNRNYSIVDTLMGSYDVQFFFLNTELTALQSVVPTATLANINVTKVKDGTACNSDFGYGNAANDTLLLQTASGSAGGVSWITIKTNGFSNFYLHPGTTQLSRLYVFNGNGAWSNPANWSNNEVPPAQLPPHSAIEIKPVAGGQCILDVPQRVPASSTFRVKSGTNIVVPGSIIVQ